MFDFLATEAPAINLCERLRVLRSNIYSATNIIFTKFTSVGKI